METICSQFEKAYRENYRLVYEYIYRVLHLDAHQTEELAQEVFLVAYQKWEVLKDHPDISGYLLLVTRNKIRKWAARRSVNSLTD